MSSTDPHPTTPAPRVLTSVAPILSIFTLRPKAVTVKPEAPAPRRSRGTAALVAATALVSLGLLGWYLAKSPESRQALPVVFVNGAPQEKISDGGKPERWASGPVKVKIDASVQQLGPGAVAAVHAGFGAWVESDATLPGLTFDTASGLTPKLQPDGVNAVMYAPIELPGHQKALALTISFVDAETGRILESDVVINSKKPFGLLGSDDPGPNASENEHDDDDGFEANEVPSCSGKYDLQSVVAHEAGHFFGLGEDPDDPATTMFFKTGKCEIRKRDLEVPDRTVMVRLYEQPAPGGDPADSGGGCGVASIAHRPGSGGQLALAFGLSLWAWARRRRCGRA